MTNEELIDKHLELILHSNKKVNLTSIRNKKDGLLLHVEDSLSGLKELQDAPIGLYGDMGTGGGYPGIPLAIQSKRKTVLIESHQKKVEVLKLILLELNLDKQISIYHGRLEELAREKPESFSVLTARAVSKLSSLIELASPLLQTKGRLICYKSLLVENELLQAQALEPRLGMKLLSKRDFLLSDQITNRCIIVFEKIKQPTVVLPRKTGLAQKRPFIK